MSPTQYREGVIQMAKVSDNETTAGKNQTVKEWLVELATTNQSTDQDSIKMQNLLRRCGFPSAVVTCGIVYTEGVGRPLDIHSMAKMILQATPGQEG